MAGIIKGINRTEKIYLQKLGKVKLTSKVGLD